MGRKRIDENLRKEKISVRIEKELLDNLRVKECNISKLVNRLVKEYLKSNRGNID